MAMEVTDPEAAALTRAFAAMTGVGISDAIVIAMREAIARRRLAETPQETAARLRAEFGISLSDPMWTPLPREVYDEMSGETRGGD